LGAIFISYRRSDSQGEAGRVFDDLVTHFGEHKVFIDVAGIEAGRDFRKAIEESVAQCDVLLVVVGPEWLNVKDQSGASRLNDPADFVRIETASALRRDIAVIPVLVRGAEMPRAEQLPEDLKGLAYRNCVELTHVRWKSDIQLLIEALRRLIRDSSQTGTRTGSNDAIVPAQPGTPHPEVTRPSKLENSSARIDPNVMQRVSRDLALHIGPIADIVVRRAASHCTSVEDLYLRVAEEIDSRDQRDKFLLGRSPIRATPLPEPVGAATLASHPSAALGNEGRLETAPAATGARRSSPRKYWLLISGGVVFVTLMLVLAARFGAGRGSNSSRTGQISQQETHNAEFPLVKTVPSAPPEEKSAKSDQPTPSEEKSAKSDQPTPSEEKSAKSDQPTPSEEKSAKSDQPTPSPATQATDENELLPPRRIRVSQEVSQDLLISKVVPAYPPLARQARIQGAVVFDADISAEGTVEALSAIRGHPMLVQAAIDAVKQWRYKPYVLNGAPAPVNTQIIVDFTLSVR
jgi:TonB family protein